MNIEYLLFNIIVLAGPLYFGLQPKFNFQNKFKYAFAAIFIAALPYIFWDILVTDKHWYFNRDYTISLRIFNLPPGEILFFISVPLACIFTWEMIIQNSINKHINVSKYISSLVAVLPIAGVYFFLSGREYTGLTLIFMGAAFLSDLLMRIELYRRKQFYFLLLLVVVFILIFNGYLTARPVVKYNPIYQLDFRIFTIPLEDFGYGISLIYFVIIAYEKIRKK